MSDRANDAQPEDALKKLFRTAVNRVVDQVYNITHGPETRLDLSYQVPEVLLPCLRDEHPYQKFFGDEVEQFYGSVIYETQ